MGGAFPVGAELAVTCAHVVGQALGTPPGTRPADGAEIILDLPLSEDRRPVTAHPHRWDERRDIAVLRCGCLPDQAAGIRLVRVADLWHHPVRVFGFQAHQDQGVWHSGRLLDRQGDGWVQTEMESVHGYRVSRGSAVPPSGTDG